MSPPASGSAPERCTFSPRVRSSQLLYPAVDQSPARWPRQSSPPWDCLWQASHPASAAESCPAVGSGPGPASSADDRPPSETDTCCPAKRRSAHQTVRLRPAPRRAKSPSDRRGSPSPFRSSAAPAQAPGSILHPRALSMSGRRRDPSRSAATETRPAFRLVPWKERRAHSSPASWRLAASQATARQPFR